MSGPLGSAQWMYASETGYQIDDSLRFEDGSSAYLNRTPAAAGNRKTWTWSGWVKRGNLSRGDIFSRGDTYIEFVSDKLQANLRNASTNYILDSSAVFRDPSAWYHIVWQLDTTQATESDRVKIYVNGSEIALTELSSGYPPQNHEALINSTSEHNIGYSYNYFDGYLADVNFIDGQALDASSFGQFTNGYWEAKDYSGTYGTNGFHLDFNGNTNDASGNGNNWTANNISAHDYVPDSPTNNFATFNALEPQSNVYTFSEGNLKAVAPVSGYPYVLSTMFVSSKKWYGEFLLNSSNGYELIGIATAPFYGSKLIGSAADSWGYATWNGTVFNNNSGTAYGNTYTTGDIIGVAMDLENNYLYFSKNGVWQNSGNPASGASGTGGINISSISGTAVSMGVSNNDNSNSSTFTANFGQDSTFAGATTAGGNTDANGIGDFKYAVPSGYLALCTANLPTPSIVDGSTAFNTVTYTGTGTTNAITGVGFSPDFVWGKQRSGVNSHELYDTVRGVNQIIYSDLTDAEGTNANGISSFDADGYTVAGNTSINLTSASVVAWNWKAGGTAVSNTDGSITSQVSANTDAGFSIVSYTGNGTAGATVGHGLGKIPSCIICKRRDLSDNWIVYHQGIASDAQTDYLHLDLTNAAADNVGAWNDTAPSSTVFTLGNFANHNANNATNIAYVFADTDGYCKAGSYTGNGSSDGPFVYTGFRPAFVMSKRTNSTGYWNMFDTDRDINDSTGKQLWANDSGAEASSSGNLIDILSNGFKCRGTGSDTNASGSTYIYLAFASSPFKFSPAR